MRDKCPYQWLTKDGVHYHVCKYLDGHEQRHECRDCGAIQDE